jgi:hypothetical protein
MHDIEIEVFDSPVLELLSANGFHPLSVVEGVPELRYKVEVFTLDEPVFDGSRDALAALFLVSVIFKSISFKTQALCFLHTTCAVKQAVAGFDGVVDLISTCLIRHLPEPTWKDRVRTRFPEPHDQVLLTQSLRWAFRSHYST